RIEIGEVPFARAAKPLFAAKFIQLQNQCDVMMFIAHPASIRLVCFLATVLPDAFLSVALYGRSTVETTDAASFAVLCELCARNPLEKERNVERKARKVPQSSQSGFFTVYQCSLMSFGKTTKASNIVRRLIASPILAPAQMKYNAVISSFPRCANAST